MPQEERDFNPNYEFVQEEAEEYFDLPVAAGALCAWPCLTSNTKVSKEKVLDGLLLLGKSWNIVSLDGFQRLQKFPTLFARKKGSYKGLEEQFKLYKHIFEFQLCIVDGLVLNLLVCTKYATVLKAISPPKLIEACKHGIKKAIMTLPDDSKTKRDLICRLDDNIGIDYRDWEFIGNNLQHFLHRSSLEHQSVFPTNPEFWFMVKRFGQDYTLGDAGPWPVFPRLNVAKATACVVHCAYDLALSGHCLWFKTTALQSAFGKRPTPGFYRVGCLPGLGNGTFKFSGGPISQVTFYTRIFHEIHRDELGILWSNEMTGIISKTLGESLQKTEKPSRKLTIKEKTVFSTKILHLLMALSEVVPSQVPGRLEFVVSLTAGNLNFPNVELLLKAAFRLTDQRLNNSPFQSLNACMHAMKMDDLIRRTRIILLPVAYTLDQIQAKVFKLYQLQHPYEASATTKITRDDIYNYYVCNAILRFFFRGSFIYGFPRWIKSFLGITENELQLLQSYPIADWPFQNLQVETNNQVCGVYTDGYPLIPNNHKIFNTPFLELYNDFMDSYHELLATDQESPNRRTNLTRMTSKFVSLLVFHSIQECFANSNVLPSLHLLWDHRLRNRCTKWFTTYEVLRNLYQPRNVATPRTRGISKKHKQLLVLLQMLLDNFPGIITVIAGSLEAAIISSRCPFKFVFNSTTQVMVLPIGLLNSVEVDAFCHTWRMAFLGRFKREQGSRPIDLAYLLNRLSTWCLIEDESRLQAKKNLRADQVLELLNTLLDSEPTHFMSLPPEFCLYISGRTESQSPQTGPSGTQSINITTNPNFSSGFYEQDDSVQDDSESLGHITQENPVLNAQSNTSNIITQSSTAGGASAYAARLRRKRREVTPQSVSSDDPGVASRVKQRCRDSVPTETSSSQDSG